MKELFLYLNGIRPMSPALIERISKLLKRQVFLKGTPILLEGEVCRQILFIESGFIGLTSFDGKKDVISWLLIDGEICIDPESFFTQRPSEQTMWAYEDSVVWGISYDELFELFNDHGEFLWHGFFILLHYYLLSLQKGKDAAMLTAEQRYLLLYERSPHFFKWGRIKYVAPYLGIDESTLSAIRTKLGHTKKK